jgi:hypothetical protein
MNETFKSSDFLRDIWSKLNNICFDGNLPEPSTIGWCSLDDDEGHGIFGMFSPTTNAISISRRFYIIEKRNTQLRSICSDHSISKKEKDEKSKQHLAYLDIAVGLVAHEMAHQASYYFDKGPFNHGKNYLKWANHIASSMDWPEVQDECSDTWPVEVLLRINKLGL